MQCGATVTTVAHENAYWPLPLGQCSPHVPGCPSHWLTWLDSKTQKLSKENQPA